MTKRAAAYVVAFLIIEIFPKKISQPFSMTAKNADKVSRATKTGKSQIKLEI